ncbi:hypothetical protein RYX36_026697 [Vicia faba]
MDIEIIARFIKRSSFVATFYASAQRIMMQSAANPVLCKASSFITTFISGRDLLHFSKEIEGSISIYERGRKKDEIVDVHSLILTTEILSLTTENWIPWVCKFVIVLIYNHALLH